MWCEIAKKTGHTFVFPSTFTLIWFLSTELAGAYLRSCHQHLYLCKKHLAPFSFVVVPFPPLSNQEKKTPAKRCRNTWL